MAGKETPRQKMINMMYLIFIAMLALNLSKQILQSFGTMNEELTETNLELVERNEQFMQGLREKADEQADKYLDLKIKADSIREISTGLYNYLENFSFPIITDPSAMTKGTPYLLMISLISGCLLEINFSTIFFHFGSRYRTAIAIE